MMDKKAFLLAAALAAMPLAVQPDPLGHGPLGFARAHAQQMGNEPWNYSRASRGFWASFQAVRKSQDDGATATGAGGGGSGAEVNQYYSVTNSTAIANQNVITQTLGDGATGIIGNHVTQDSLGNQTAHAHGESTVRTDNSITTITGR